jgi:hypothetical protein
MKQANELINSIEMSSTEMIAPISALYKANKITGEEFFNICDHMVKISNTAFKKGYWKSVQLTKGDNYVIQILGDGRAKEE